MDIIDLNGIISPGTYQNYLEKEYQRANGVIISKNVYNQLTIDHKWDIIMEYYGYVKERQ